MHPARAVREARRRAGLTQVELARRAAMHVQVVNRIERGLVNPKFGTVMALLEAAQADLVVAPRRGAQIHRESIRELLARDPRFRLEREHLAALDQLCRRKVRFIVLGDAAIRLHGGPIDVCTVEISVGPERFRYGRLRRVARSGALSCVVIRSGLQYWRMRDDAEPLPWLPPPRMRVLNRWIDSPTGYLPSLAEPSAVADDDTRELLAAVEDEIDRVSPGFRIYRRRADR